MASVSNARGLSLGARIRLNGVIHWIFPLLKHPKMLVAISKLNTISVGVRPHERVGIPSSPNISPKSSYLGKQQGTSTVVASSVIGMGWSWDLGAGRACSEQTTCDRETRVWPPRTAPN